MDKFLIINLVRNFPLLLEILRYFVFDVIFISEAFEFKGFRFISKVYDQWFNDNLNVGLLINKKHKFINLNYIHY